MATQEWPGGRYRLRLPAYIDEVYYNARAVADFPEGQMLPSDAEKVDLETPLSDGIDSTVDDGPKSMAEMQQANAV